MDQKQGIPSDQPPMGYPAQAPPAHQGQPPVAEQQPQGYPVQQQPGYPGQPQPGYPGQPQPGYGGPIGRVPPAQKMNNNLVLAIIATLCCCPICGIIGIYFAAKVDSAFYRGDVAKAQEYANNAKGWSIAAIVLGLVLIVILVVVQFTATSRVQTYY